MGYACHTPSPIREPYISSSNVNSPQTRQETYKSRPDDLASCLQRIETRGSEHAAVESLKPHQRRTAASLYPQDMFGAEGGSADQKADQKLNSYTADVDKQSKGSVPLEEPCTPKRKRMPILWHGLPSPETPSFHGDVQDALSAGSAQEELIWQTSLSRTKDAVEVALENAKDAANQLPALVQSHTNSNDADNHDAETAYPQTLKGTTKHDAKLARKLGESLNATATRRSTRLRAQPQPFYTAHAPIAAPKSARKPISLPVARELDAQPEFSVVPVKADPVPFEGLPNVHSLSWQLQYPPGGSTHPSYPYPVLDPRLLFHQAFVPIIGGLPDFTLVPKLVLPMGWKHVSWSGLLPIAFDPYRQAFKLTPVGPMPLTCEELHQQGLHKYVPGGELHPEYGLVPDLLKLSDGSDAEVFNFDGVDWTLPWEGQVDFHAPSHATSERIGSCNSASPVSSETFIPVITYPWSEARDCPNKVFDVSDAWRWLSTKETNPTADFVPTPAMKWHGSGAFRSTRKLKSPIPELMMHAMQPDSTTPSPQLNPLLQNQDRTNKDKNQFCPFKSVATPVTVDITLLGDTEFTILELLSYFPQHYYWGHAAERLARASVTGGLIRDFLIMTRGLQGDEIMMASSIGGATKIARKRDCVKVEETDRIEEIDIDEIGKDTPSPTPAPAIKSTIVDPTVSYTAEGWTYDVWDKIDYPVLALAHGLQSLPTGLDAGPVTALILWCKENGRYQALLSEVPALLKEAKIEPLIEPGENECPDKEVVGRYAEALKKDRLRVVRDAGANKRALDGSISETRGKRRKAE